MNLTHYYKMLFLTVGISPLNALANSETIPSMAFLEYLAEMKEVNGELIGPQDIQTTHCLTLEKLKNQKVIESVELVNESIKKYKEECKNDV